MGGGEVEGGMGVGGGRLEEGGGEGGLPPDGSICVCVQRERNVYARMVHTWLLRVTLHHGVSCTTPRIQLVFFS